MTQRNIRQDAIKGARLMNTCTSIKLTLHMIISMHTYHTHMQIYMPACMHVTYMYMSVYTPTCSIQGMCACWNGVISGHSCCPTEKGIVSV